MRPMSRYPNSTKKEPQYLLGSTMVINEFGLTTFLTQELVPLANSSAVVATREQSSTRTKILSRIK